MLSKTKLGSLLLAGVLVFSLSAIADSGAVRSDAELQAAVSKQLQKAEFKDVRSSVQDGVVTLTGTVDTYQHKLDAAKKAGKAAHFKAVRDEVQVAGPAISDTALRDQLAGRLRYIPYGIDNLFDVVQVGVHNGVVTLSGQVIDPVDRSYVFSEVANAPGVKGIVDAIAVAPVSGFDDGLRIRAARAIFSDPVLSRYAMDPQNPIRIVVNNGHIALYGSVDSTMDSQVAFMRASQVFGAFKVENHLTTPQGKVG